MKNLLILLGFISVLFVSCSSDNDDNNGELPINATNLLGKWYMKGGTISTGEIVDYTHFCPSKKDFQLFTDENVTLTRYGVNCDLREVETNLWNLNSDTLKIFNSMNSPTHEFTFVVEKITSQELRLKEIEYDYDNNAILVHYIEYTRN